jgi:hypothetical protein
MSAAYATPWWRYSYWLDHSTAEALTAGFPGFTSFSQVRDEYARARDTVVAFNVELARLHADVAAGVAIEQEYASLYEEHRTLDESALAAARERIVEHLLTCDASLMAERLRGSPDLRLLFLRASALNGGTLQLDDGP